MPRCQSLKSILWGHSRARSLLKNYDSLDCERGGCDDEARRPGISVVICKGGATKSARPPRHKVNCCSFSTDSWVHGQESRSCPRPGCPSARPSRSDIRFPSYSPTRRHSPLALQTRSRPSLTAVLYFQLVVDLRDSGNFLSQVGN